ncbi:sulfatase [Cerasicoccus arenae]|nr:sulfatase [Cerasicoccus arenae]MBK1859217.1 sulfatase [Cerasicoccus arenae]
MQKIFPTLCAILSLFAASIILASANMQPNVVFIVADDLFINIGCYGNNRIQTPNLDRLAQKGVIFDRAYANYPLCGPSRNSMMSGRYAEDTGLIGLRDKLRERHVNIITLSQHFMNHGYVAARVGKIYHADNPDGIGRADHDDPESWHIAIDPIGYDKTIEDDIIRISHLREEIKNNDGLGAQLSWFADPVKTDEEHTDGKVASESIKLMEQFIAEETPFFLGVGFYKPHTPFVAPKKYFDLYDSSDFEPPKVPEDYLTHLPGPAVESIRVDKPWMPGQIDIPDPLAREVIHAYYATVSYLDANVGRVLQAIDDLGIADNTIVVFISDHGFHLGEHGHWQKKTLFDQANHIPLMVYDPRAKGNGQRSSTTVELVDIYRTLSDLVGLPEPVWTSGESFARAVDAPAWVGREAAISAVGDSDSRNFSIRTPEWRFTSWCYGEAGKELYLEKEDPSEMINHADEDVFANDISRLELQLNQRLEIMHTDPSKH